jgi:hypothetical protein
LMDASIIPVNVYLSARVLKLSNLREPELHD